MKKVMLIALLTIAIISVSGCIQGDTDTKTGGAPAIAITYNMYGEILSYSIQGNTIDLTVQASIIDYELEDKTVDITAEIGGTIATNKIENNKNLALYFVKGKEEDAWVLSEIIEDLAKYKERGLTYHKNDLKINQLTNVETYENATAQQIISSVINNIGEETELAIELQNYQDNDITYRILNADIRSEFANDVVEACQISFDDTENIIVGRESSLIPYTTEILRFNVLCDDTVEKENTRESCDINGENCQTITTPNKFILWGQIEFTDELGLLNKHIIPEQRVLKQHIDIE
ncbi:MAG: hypothetical protein KJ906_01285 [Nanoarchaeota archaeon]|nr:hypothetical protein [Nanoarchaeota archaeon]